MLISNIRLHHHCSHQGAHVNLTGQLFQNLDHIHKCNFFSSRITMCLKISGYITSCKSNVNLPEPGNVVEYASAKVSFAMLAVVGVAEGEERV